MLNKLMSKINPTFEGLVKELLSDNFNKKTALDIINSSKVNINQQNHNGDTVLHLCLYNFGFNEAIWLINQNIDTSIKNNDGLTVLRVAVQKGNTEVVDKLIRQSTVDVNEIDSSKRSLMQDAVIYGHKNIVSLLNLYIEDINTLDNNNRNVMFDSIAYGDNELTNQLLENKDIDLNVIDNCGKTILHHPNIENNEELAINLLEKGADPTICDKDGNNFLLKAALKGKHGESILKTAVRLGCNLNTKVSNKNSILMEVMFAFSKISSHESDRRDELKSIAKRLINYGIDTKAINMQNETVLFELVRLCDIEGCAFILEHEININHQNDDKETALFMAIYKGVKNLDLIILLLQYGADPSLKNKNNQCVVEILNNIVLHTHQKKRLECKKTLNLISSNGNYLILLKEILQGGRSSYEYFDSIGNPLFFMPFLCDHFELTKLYLKIGVDVNIKNKIGNSLFYEYNLMKFEKKEFCNRYRQSLIFLLSNHANILSKNKDNQTVFSKIPLIPNCNLDLFRTLIEVTRYDYTIQDNRGRTIMHSCVWGNNLQLVNLIYGVGKNIQNIADNYNILPITYAALFGNKEMVSIFLKKESQITTGLKIPKIVIKNFKPMFNNLDTLTQKCRDPDLLSKIRILVKTIKQDFIDNSN